MAHRVARHPKYGRRSPRCPLRKRGHPGVGSHGQLSQGWSGGVIRLWGTRLVRPEAARHGQRGTESIAPGRDPGSRSGGIARPVRCAGFLAQCTGMPQTGPGLPVHPMPAGSVCRSERPQSWEIRSAPDQPMGTRPTVWVAPPTKTHTEKIVDMPTLFKCTGFTHSVGDP